MKIKFNWVLIVVIAVIVYAVFFTTWFEKSPETGQTQVVDEVLKSESGFEEVKLYCHQTADELSLPSKLDCDSYEEMHLYAEEQRDLGKIVYGPWNSPSDWFCPYYVEVCN
jgi:hypothetical protein